MTDVYSIAARNWAELEAEERKIAAAIDEAKQTGVALHDGYWKKHYLLRERQRLLKAILEVG